MYFKKYFIVMKEKKKDKVIEIKFRMEKFTLPESIILFNPNNVTALKVGIESKKEILAESNLWNLRILAADIVIPDLLTPGIKDNIWNKPIIIADL